MSRRLLFGAAALLVLGCEPRQKPAPVQAEAPRPAQAEPAREVPPAAAPEAQSVGRPPDVTRPDAARAQVKLAVGISRRDLLTTLGRCAQRAEFLPGRNGGVTVELFQPATPDCVKQFGARQFVVTAGKSVTEIRPGLFSPEPPQAPQSRPW